MHNGRVPIQTWVPPWVKEGLKREAAVDERLASNLFARWRLADPRWDAVVAMRFELPRATRY